MSLNKFMGIGNLTKDVELKYTASGSPVANFSIAMNEKYTDKQGQKQEKAEFLRITVWGSKAENCNKYLSKGSQVFVEGKVTTRSYEDKDGNKKYTTEINASNIQFIGGGSNADSAKPSTTQGDYSPSSSDNAFSSDQIPF